jgi:L,D-transpeptidase YcbB
VPANYLKLYLKQGSCVVPQDGLVRSERRVEIAILLLAASLLLCGQAFGQGRKSVAARVSAIVASGRLGELHWPNFSGYRSQLINFYRPSGYRLAWVRGGEPTPQAVELVEILQDAEREGLRAYDYDATRWPDRLTLLRGPHEEAEEARFDVALTVCIMRYLSDLHVGRINPQHLGFEFDVSGKKLDLPSFLRECLVEGSGLHEEVATLEPRFPGYERLRDALPHYVELAKRDDGEKLPVPARLAPGGQYAGIPRLTRLLRLLGDMPESVTIPPDSKIYEGALVDAVKHFQGRHGLPPTGVLDSDTVAEMNVPLSGRVAQIRLGLERYRWLPYDPGQPAIVVNVPEFRLYAFTAGRQPAFSMKVTVGDDYDFQTPIFEKKMLYVVFRPYWYPPRTILRSEILSDLKEDSSLEENDVELVSASGQVMSRGNVTPAMLGQLQSGELTARQPPGPDNALGLIKFILPNEHNIYIHDTPVSVHMFSDTERIFSHGCIHAQEPAKLAAWLLRDKPGWSLEQVEHAMHKGRNNVRVNLASPVPVLIVYDTAVVQENGDIHFLEDIYQHDGKLEVELAEGYPYASGAARSVGRN